LVSNKARVGLVDFFDGTEQGVSRVVDDDVEAPEVSVRGSNGVEHRTALRHVEGQSLHGRGGRLGR
jgi:hypothetical protein